MAFKASLRALTPRVSSLQGLALRLSGMTALARRSAQTGIALIPFNEYREQEPLGNKGPLHPHY